MILRFANALGAIYPPPKKKKKKKKSPFFLQTALPPTVPFSTHEGAFLILYFVVERNLFKDFHYGLPAEW